MMVKRLFSVVFIGFIAVTVACSGSSDGGVITGPAVGATFIPEEINPPPETVSMAQSTVSGDRVTVAVNITDTSGIFGAAFDVAYDASLASFETWSPGTILEQGGNAPNYVVNSTQPGHLIIGISRTGNVSTVSATGTQPLLRLTFRVLQAGAAPVSFTNKALTNDLVDPLPRVVWFGGALAGS